MTAGQVPLAATASTITSSKPLAGTGAGITTGPTTTTLNDCVKFGDTAGTLADAGAACGSGSGGLSGMTTGQLPVAASATTVTSSIAYATANTASTIVERDGSGNFSAGTIAAGATTPTTIGSNGVLLNGVPALQSQTSLNNYYSGGAGNLTGTGNNNTANGYEALYANTTGSNNTANGSGALQHHGHNTANGYRRSQHHRLQQHREWVQALYANTTGYSNTANGYVTALNTPTPPAPQHREWDAALYSNTTGSNNTANGYQAGQYIADGVTANQTSSNSVYEGFQAYPLANGDTNENVIGNTAIGHGSNTTTLGNSATVGTWLNGTQHITATAPTASAGTVAAYSTNAGGEITGLSAATTVTITFANSGWTNAAFCVANSSVAATQPYVTAQSKTAVTFTFPGTDRQPVLSLRRKLRRIKMERIG